MVNKDMNECLTSSGMRKMKTTAEQHCTPSRAATVICETDTTKYLEPPQPSYATGRSRVSTTALDHGFTVSTKETPYPSDPTTPFLEIRQYAQRSEEKKKKSVKSLSCVQLFETP